MTIKNNFYIDDFIVSCLINIVFLDTTDSVFVFQIPVFVFFHTQEPSLVAFSKKKLVGNGFRGKGRWL
jgi:hypothetical protein